MSSEPTLPTVGVLGLGMMGASLAAALSQRGYRVFGFDNHAESLLEAEQIGLISGPLDLAAKQLVKGDVFIIAIPVLAVAKYSSLICKLLERGVVVTDICSTKGYLADLFADVQGSENLVLGHPIAGSERAGVANAEPTLFEEQSVILTPVDNTTDEALSVVRKLWHQIGAKSAVMTVEEHDQILAATSHLPHFLAFSLVDTLAGDAQNRKIFQYAAGGFRDFTRIAASDSRMWHDIAQTNQTALLQALDSAIEGFGALRAMIAEGDSNKLMGVLTRSKVARDHFGAVLQQRSYRQYKVDSMDFIAKAGGAVVGDIRVPGDKSMSHRSIMLGALADGVTHVSGFLEGEDALATLQAFRDMGVVIEGPERGEVVIHGVGIDGLSPPPSELYVGNSGTTIRLLSGLLAGQQFSTEMSGDSSLAKRPMRRVTVPLAEMGAAISTAEDGTPPVRIAKSVQGLQGIHYELPIASAQVKSALLLAGLYADGTTTVVEPAPTRDHTERMLRGFGYPVETNGDTISLVGGGRLTACDIDVPADISSSAFFLVAAAITPGSDLWLRHVGVNPTRIGVINILRAMGANISVENERSVGGEPVADLHIQYAPLKGIDIPEDQVPLAIDEFPVLFIAAACAEGKTVLTGAEELRVKESDRIQVMADGLQALGVNATATPDGMIIHGGPIGGGEVVSHDDHRIAMAFSVASLRANDDIVIRDCENVATSFPNFVELCASVGKAIEIEKHG
ncbi:bifunctional prephenate dehydrogenase/3-phosphoshikimate 1-carboxyvinyltransferase [uncultured Umboniibacter sp.]|uniref:bifunctional prephenate dehydrogenase/3-phosphoshikimate 1-carboxyvinyltransferase n=1 Tax=uncultured Umboniibacter sp. TaxID=1798917 RepID=UPI00261EEFE0|nr:bifunctional prephenate dehydrogenase/3-phosphoshikimate 1-carboxyvinyltransferase [uncultured Umboniibacter sp.]